MKRERRPLNPKRMVSDVIKNQHKAARREANKNGLKLVTETVARLIRDAGGPPYMPVAPTIGLSLVPSERHGEFLTGMPQAIVARIQSPPPEFVGLKLETIVMLAIEEWKAVRERPAYER